jgi:hypothetical protein
MAMQALERKPRANRALATRPRLVTRHPRVMRRLLVTLRLLAMPLLLATRPPLAMPLRRGMPTPRAAITTRPSRHRPLTPVVAMRPRVQAPALRRPARPARA